MRFSKGPFWEMRSMATGLLSSWIVKLNKLKLEHIEVKIFPGVSIFI